MGCECLRCEYDRAASQLKELTQRVFFLTPTFLQYLEATRPGLVAALELEVGDYVHVHEGSARCLVEFVDREPLQNEWLDRQVHTDVPCLVLDKHPREYSLEDVEYGKGYVTPNLEPGEFVRDKAGELYVVISRVDYSAVLAKLSDACKTVDTDEVQVYRSFSKVVDPQ